MNGLLSLALGVGAAAGPVFVDADAARRLVGEGALVLDARGPAASAPHLPGAVVADWRQTRDGLFRVGRLMAASAARKRYGGLGVTTARPVLVYGAALEGWGEEGRVWWDLVFLGHPAVRILDGGIRAWVEAGHPTADRTAPPQPARFAGETNPALRADDAAVLAASEAGGPVLDTRTYDEYWGATPFASPRGGHVPGAHTLHWKRLLRPDGRLLPEPALRAQLDGVIADDAGGPVIAYCTGGVRSAFVVAVLTHLGVEAQNYDGSWWAWSARSELPIETPTRPRAADPR